MKRRCVCCSGVIVSDDSQREPDMLCTLCVRDAETARSPLEDDRWYRASEGIDGGVHMEGGDWS